LKESKQISISVPPCVGLYSKRILICPRHPKMQREIIKRSAANWHHRNCTSTVGLTEPPSFVVTLLTLDTMTRREYHYPFCGLWRNRKLFDILSQYCSLYLSASHGVLLRTLMLITITKRTYLMNEYEVVKERTCFYKKHYSSTNLTFVSLHLVWAKHQMNLH